MRTHLIPMLALVALGALAPVASAHNSQTFDVSASPLKLSKPGKPQGTNLTVGLTISSDEGKPTPLSNVVIDFPAGAKANTKAFPTCSVDTLVRQGVQACPAKSVLGKGTAAVDVRPIIERIEAKLDVVNGKPKNGVPQILFLATVTDPVQVTLVYEGALTTTPGKYGYRLVAKIPPIQPIATLPPASIIELKVTVGKKIKKGKKTINFIDAPTECRSGGFPFQAKFDYEDGASAMLTDSIACP